MINGQDITKNYLEDLIQKQLNPINQKMLKQEKVRHDRFLEKHANNYKELQARHFSFISQLITLEGAIFGAIVLFTNSQNISIWIVFTSCLILISLVFGIWSQNISIQAAYQSHEWDFIQEQKNNWFIRGLWKDNGINTEKELMESHLKEREDAYKTTITYKLLTIFHLNADRIENIFKITFVLALFFLILHVLSISIANKAPQQTSHNYMSHKMLNALHGQ